MKSKLLISTLLIAIMALSAVCWVAAAEDPQGTLTYAPRTNYIGFRKGLDPGTAQLAGEETTPGTLLFEGLVTKNEKGEYVPCLAKSWEIGPNGRYIDFTLQEGVKFHNGEPFTAEDVKFSIERYMRKDLMWIFGEALASNIDKVEIIDDYHVRILFKETFPAFFHLSTLWMWVLPKDYIEKVGDETFSEKPVGTGPFKLVEFKHEREIKMEAVKDHWRKTPYAERYHHLIAEDHSTRLAMLKTGEVDIVQLNPAQIGQVNKDPNLRLILVDHCFMSTLQMVDVAYEGPSVWKDARVRKAASLAIDRKGIIEHVMHGAATPWASFYPPHSPGHDPSLQSDPYNPEQAKKLLAEAGYPNGFETVLVSPTVVKDQMEAIAAYWTAVGIKTKLEVMEDGEWASRLTSQKERGAVFFSPEPWWSGAIHPAVLLFDLMGPWGGVPTPKWLADGYHRVSVAQGEDIFKEAKKVNQELIESGIWFPLWSVSEAFGIGPKVVSYEPVPGQMHNFRFEYVKLKK